MNFAINPINSNTLSASSPLAAYKQAQKSAKDIASVVYGSLEYLTGAENGLSLQGLKDLNQTLNNENLTQNSAYTLVNTLINNFDALSGDGESITETDFLDTIKFSVAQSFSSDSAINAILSQSGVSVAESVSAIIGSANAETLALVQFMDSLSDETIGKILSNINSASQRERKTAGMTDFSFKEEDPLAVKIVDNRVNLLV